MTQQSTQRLVYAYAGVVFIASSMPLSAGAQENVPGSSPPASLGEVIVSARKREETLQDVAVSVTALSARRLEEFAINDFYDYATLVPGLTSNFTGPVSDLGVRPVGLRGIQTVNGALASGQNTVGFYINNTPVPISNPRLSDIERIEVLRGPQGTLYGASSLGGTIKIVVREPQFDRISGSLQSSLASTHDGDENYDFDASLNLPLGDKAALRVSGYLEQRDGFIDFFEIDPLGVPTGRTRENVNDEHAEGGRLSLALEPGDRLRVVLNVMHGERDVDAQDQFTLGTGSGLLQRFYFTQPSKDRDTLIDANLTWTGESVQIVSTTAYYDKDSSFLGDQTRQASPLLVGRPPVPQTNDLALQEWTHETRVVSAWEGPLQLLAGVFYSDRDEASYSFLSGQGSPTVGPFPIPNDTILSTEDLRERREAAVFARLDWDVRDWLRLGAGLRYYDFKFRTADDFFGTALFVANNRLVSSGEASESGFVPSFSVELRPHTGQLYYASAAKGFRMGGANFPLPNAVSCNAALTAFFGGPTLPPSFDSDSLWSYEVGAKTTWREGQYALNVAAYHIDWENPQVPVSLGGLGCSFGGLTTNVGKIRSQGLEVEATLNPAPGLLLQAGVAYTDAEISEELRFPGATLSLAPAGRALPDLPEWTVSFLGQYTFSITERLDGFLRADYRYQDERADRIGSASIKEAYDIANVRIGVNYGNTEVSVFADNVFDEQPHLQGDPVPVSRTKGGLAFDTTLRPRTIGVSARWKF